VDGTESGVTGGDVSGSIAAIGIATAEVRAMIAEMRAALALRAIDGSLACRDTV
jgi:hypothetical protein